MLHFYSIIIRKSKIYHLTVLTILQDPNGRCKHHVSNSIKPIAKYLKILMSMVISCKALLINLKCLLIISCMIGVDRNLFYYI